MSPMLKFTKRILLFFMGILFTSTVYAQSYSIYANLTGFKSGTKFYLEDVEQDIKIDSAILQNNIFTIKGKLAYPPQNLWLSTVVNNKLYYCTLLIGNESIIVKGDARDFPFDLSIKGSKIQDAHNELMNLTKEGYKRRNKLVAEYSALTGDSVKIKTKAIWKTIAGIDSAADAIRKTFVNSHLNTYEGLDALFYLKDKLPKDSLELMYNSIPDNLKQTRFGKRIFTLLKAGKILSRGDSATDFKAFDDKGNLHRLSDIKDKYILLDFSTTYCGPCIESAADLKKVSKKYADILSIITFSGDASKATWLKSIERDQPEWLSLWDGQGYYGETIIKYGITGYPTFVLITPQRIIMSKWSGYDKDDNGKGSLENKLDKLLAKK